MAYVNVAEWKTDQVCEWLKEQNKKTITQWKSQEGHKHPSVRKEEREGRTKGLENSVLPYVHSFTNHGVSGQQLLSLRPDDLERLGVLKLGHQEIILEAVEHLRNFHYELDRENLQLLALRLSCQARSLCNELSGRTDTLVATQTLSDVASVVTAVKPLIRWLDRPPFSGQLDYNEKKTRLMKLSLEMATCAQRDRFAEKPIEEIRSTCEELAQLADYIVQDIADPMILQPASLDLATLKKRPTGDDLGFYVLPSFHGAHQIAEIKFGSAAHQCGKMEEGDEIVQVNYQTVVGWERKNVLELFRESPSEILLTLKRRPRHTKVYGQIYIKPYRLPSNKKTPYTTRWQHNLPSPRPELLTIPDFTMPLPRHTPVTAVAKPSPSPEPMLDSMATCTDDESSGSDSEVEQPELLSIPPHTVKPSRTVRIRRRATITGASPTTKHGIDIERFWREFKQERNTTFQLRDKAASCAHGLDGVSSTTTTTAAVSSTTTNLRPQTCLGIEQRQTMKKKKKSDEEDGKSTTVTTTDGKHASGKLSESGDKSNEANDGPKAPSNEVNNDVKIEQPVTKEDQEISGEDQEKLSPDPTNLISTGVSEGDDKIKSHNSIDVIVQDDTTQNPIMSNVARRVSDIEKYIAKSNESVMAEKVSNTHVKSTEVNHVDTRNSSTDEIQTDGQTKGDDSIDSGHENTTSINSNISVRTEGSNTKLSTRESSEEKSDSASSCIENTCESGSSEGDQTSLKTFGKILRSIDRALTEHEKLIEKNSAVERPTFVDPVKPVEEKPTPPEPPPRKYFSKPAVPERTNIRRDSKKLESDRFDGTYGNFVDESTVDSIHDEPTPMINEQKPILTSDNFSSIEPHRGRYPIPSARDDRSLEKYEPFIEKFGPKSTVPATTESYHPHLYYQYEPAPPPPPRHSAFRSPDSTDGSMYSKQHQDSSEGPRFGRVQPVEKDRGSVVNKAMMVARSIGRHGSGNKSTSGSSLRSGRKQNNLLAKKRNVSVKDVGMGDLEGWLTYRSRGAGGAWARAWFILKRSSLYRFRAQDSTKADCLIALTGFTVSQATEVKSRKYAFKIYHTGTVFYFAADTEDSLLTWLDAVEKATLAQRDTGAQHQRNSGLFSETDEDADDEEHHHEYDGDYGAKGKAPGPRLAEGKQQTMDKSSGFGSLRKVVSKDSSQGVKDHREISGSSLDRKYLRFLGGVSKNQNVPVPTAQFRSYRRVLPTSTPMKNKDTVVHSADPQMTIAGSTFYGSSTSQNLEASNSANSHDMSDYRRTTESRYFNGQNRRPPSDDLQEFVTLEEFMLSQQQQQQQQRQHRIQRAEEEEQRNFMASSHRSESPASVISAPSAGVPDHAHYRNFEEGALSPYEVYSRDASTRSNGRRLIGNPTNGCCSPYYTPQQQQCYCPNDHDCRLKKEPIVPSRDFEPTHKRFFRNGTAGSSDDLTAFLHHRNASGDTLQRVKKETMAVTRKGSFNLRRRDHATTSAEEQQQRCWIDSLKRSGSSCDKKSEKNRLKNAAQYQPPPIPASQLQFDKPEKMRAAFEMHLDKATVAERTPQKPNRLKSLFGSKSHQKPCTLDIPKDTSAQKTLLGSPILHRALCRNKSSPQQPHRLSSSVRQTNDSSGHSPAGDSGIGGGTSSIASFVSGNDCPRALSQSISSVSSSSAISPDWSPDSQPPSALTVSKYNMNHHSPSTLSAPSPSMSSSLRNSLNPPTLPYIPPPTSPPPPIFDDYPGLEYPPVFEPGTYSLSDASLLRSRNKGHHHHHHQRHNHQDSDAARDNNCEE